MIPILYNKTAVDFSGNGIGFLIDSLKCKVTEERNGAYELEMQYPISGQWYSDLCDGAIIKAKANETAALQLFRVYKSSKPIKGIVTYKAEHISYDLNGIPLAGFSVSAATPAMAIDKALGEAVTPHAFSAWSDISTLNGTTIKKPCSVRALLGGQTGSFLDVWGGEYEFDNYTIKLHKNRGIDSKVMIAYGKNLKDLKQESNISSCYTHILPYAIKKEQAAEDAEATEEYVYIPTKIIKIADAEALGHTRVYPADLTDKFGDTEEITPESLYLKAQNFADACGLNVPKVNISVSFVQLWQTEEYKNIAPLERVNLCDTVSVRFPPLGVDAKAKVIKTVYDSLNEKYDKIELGDAKSSFADTVLKQNNDMSELTEFVKKGFSHATEEIAEAIRTATNLITGQNGGYVVLNPAEKPQEILILDAPTLAEAVHVWRWNLAGLGYSSTGYNGTYALAITMDGRINANFVTVGTLNGALLKAGSVTAAAISQSFKTEVTNEIGTAISEVEQAFVAADGQLKSIIENVNTILNGDIAAVEESVSILRQTVENFMLSFTTKYTGGINLVTNSSGLNGVSDEWEYTGSVVALQDSEAIRNTLSGSAFRLRVGTLSQEIRLIAGARYTLTFKTKRTTTARGYVKINTGGNDIYIYDAQEIEDWKEYALTFVAASESLVLTAETTGYYFYIADIMLNEGDARTRWQPAMNEIYTENVKVDKRGINITNSESSTETIIDNTQFAVKHKGETVLTVNKDLTTLRKTEIVEDLTVNKLKLATAADGIDLILLD